jgi:hypothetical protein
MGQRKPKAANENEYYLKEFLQKSVIQNGFIKNVESKNLILGENSFQNQNSAKYQKHILLQTLQEKPLENGLMGDVQKTKWQDKQNNDDVQGIPSNNIHFHLQLLVFVGPLQYNFHRLPPYLFHGKFLPFLFVMTLMLSEFVVV